MFTGVRPLFLIYNDMVNCLCLKQAGLSHSEAEAWLQRWSEVACSLLCFITGNIGLLAFPVKLGTLQTSYFCICREIFSLFSFFETISSYTSHVGLALTILPSQVPWC